MARPRLKVAAVEETWQQLVRNRPGVEDLVGAKLIPIAAIDPNPDQPRRGPLTGIEELAASVVEYGLLQPIVVEPPRSGRYTLIAGARRLAAFRHLFATRTEGASRWTTIPAIERDTHTADRLVLALLENMSRQDLSEGEMVTALRLLRDLRQWGTSEIARHLGVTRQWIQQYFRVANDPTLSQHVQAGQLSIAKAQDIRLARTPEARQAALDAAVQGAPLRRIREIAKGQPAQGPVNEPGQPQAVQSHFAPGEGSDRAQSDCAPSEGSDRAQSDCAPGEGGNRVQSDFAPEGGPAGEGHAGGAQTVATAAPDAGARDLADLAGEMGLTTTLGALQLAKLIRSALQAGTDTVEVSALIRLMRADMRHLDAVVRSAARERR